MGSWNGTDMITQLPILEGESVVYYILEPGFDASSGRGGFCYPTGKFRPMFLPIRGTYDSYGRITNIEESVFTSRIVKYFKEAVEQGVIQFKRDEIYSERQVSNEIPPLTIEEIVYGIERGYVSFVNSGRQLGAAMILSDIWEKCISVVGNSSVGLYNSGGNVLEATEARLDTAIQDTTSLSPDSVFGALSARNFFGYDEVGQDIYTLTTDSICRAAEQERSHIHSSSPLYPADLREILRGLISMRLMDHFLSYTRKFWSVQSGAGSQVCEYNLMLDLGKITNDALLERIKLMEE